MKLIVAGSRTVTNYNIVKRYLDSYRKRVNFTTIISGRAQGADAMGEKYAKENNIELELYPAEWKKFGKSAGYKRNEVMATKADLLIVFWDGVSRGTKHMIDIAKSKLIPTTIIDDSLLFKEKVIIDSNDYENYDAELNKIESNNIIEEYFPEFFKD